MKKLSTYTLIFCLTFILLLSYYSNTPVHANTTVKQSYTVAEVHSSYIVAQSDKYKDEYIKFYYDDQSHKQTFNVNDKVAAYFKPDGNEYKIIDFVKGDN